MGNTCPHCKEEVSWSATRCPHCTSELGNQTGFWKYIVWAVLLYWIYSAIFG